MYKKCLHPNYLFISSFLFGSLIFSNSLAQVGIKTPLYNTSAHSDSSRIGFSKPVLPLRNWHDPSDHYFNLRHNDSGLDVWQYISPNAFPTDPFKVDKRGSSYYVPTMVRDELNLIMNRPKDAAFVPILPAAFLALQLAGQYLLVKEKTEITPEDVRNAEEGRPILVELWKRSPQTLSELYKSPGLRDNYTMLELQRLVDILIENKLVKRKLIEKSETQYFYALDEIRYDQFVERFKIEQSSPSDSIQSPSVEWKIPTNKTMSD
jgi:hypothetical protein